MDILLKPVMEFRAPIVEVRKVPTGTPVSYGGVFTTKSESNIGVIQCGFADGIPRAWTIPAVSHSVQILQQSVRCIWDHISDSPAF